MSLNGSEGMIYPYFSRYRPTKTDKGCSPKSYVSGELINGVNSTANSTELLSQIGVHGGVIVGSNDCSS